MTVPVDQQLMLVEITTTVNGQETTMPVPPRLHVADFLRQRLGLTGTHIGCEQGSCGMCTVIVDGEAVKSCLMLACQLDGRNVETVESLARDDELGWAATFLASPYARFISGHTLVVDGANWQRRTLTNPPIVTVRP